MTTLNAAQLKELRQTLLFTRNDIGVGPAELKRWSMRAEKVHAEITTTIEAGTTKRNAELMGKVVESLASLADQIKRIDDHVFAVEARQEFEAFMADREPSNVIDFASFAARKHA
jgi:hypothetical protein